MSIECFFEKYQHTFSAVGSVATAMAVWIALRQNRPKAKILLDYDKSKAGTYHKIMIINRGTIPFKVDRRSFVINIPFSKKLSFFCYDFHSSRVKEPLTIEINDSVELNLYKVNDDFCKKYFCAQMKSVSKLLLKFAKINVITTSGISFSIKIPERLMNDLECISRETQI
ncbi:MAG: hypothetical protein SFV53_03205 [Rickettsiales bacterium]|nr:hypothetical protein [Rickettsiales bacterium]